VHLPVGNYLHRGRAFSDAPMIVLSSSPAGPTEASSAKIQPRTPCRMDKKESPMIRSRASSDFSTFLYSPADPPPPLVESCMRGDSIRSPRMSAVKRGLYVTIQEFLKNLNLKFNPPGVIPPPPSFWGSANKDISLFFIPFQVAHVSISSPIALVKPLSSSFSPSRGFFRRS